ncbi:MAG: aryldialkylphosphatase [Acidimicrobiia bacterium]
MSGFIRTIGGDLPTGLIGPTYVHEHLIIDTPLVAATMPHIHLPSVEEARAEVETCVAAGVRTMVDAMPAASGRDPERLARISITTGMRVVAATGLHTERYYDGVAWARDESAEQLAARFIADIEVGIDRHDYLGDRVERTEARAGIVKVAMLADDLSARDQRLFEAGAMTATTTGVPILTHAEAGRGGLRQIETLLGHGISPDRIALSHTDKRADNRYHGAMLETGVFLCYDQGLREPEQTWRLVDEMVLAGHEGQLLMGTDGARRSLWSTLGGSPGLASLYRTAVDRLGPDLVRTLFVDNPARYLSLSG